MTEQFTDSDGTWETLKMNGEYEINREYPYHIRKKSKRHRYIRESKTETGYVVLSIDRKFVRKHNVIASQWLPNVDNKETIDHINRDPSDNHLDNLHWVSFSDNTRNKRAHKKVQYEYVHDLPEGFMTIHKCHGWNFENLFFKDGTFYTKVNEMYRKLVMIGDDNKHIHVKDTDGKFRAIMHNIFRREIAP
jgi:hypothetical protein